MTIFREFNVRGSRERSGTGLKRIMELCKELNIRPPEFIEIGDLLRVNFYRPTYNHGSYTAESAVKVPSKCPESAEKVYNAILEHPKSSNKDLCVILGLSDRAVRNQIKTLKDAGCIVRVGSDKSGYWEIKE